VQLPHLAGRRAPGGTYLAGRTPLVRPGPDAEAILGSIGEVLYQWDIASDRLDWGPGQAAVLGPFARLDLTTGMAFGALIAGENRASRYDAVFNAIERDAGDGVVYRLVYALAPTPGTGAVSPLWIEDTGRWFAGDDGRPSRAHGVLRALVDPKDGAQPGAISSALDPVTGLPDRSRLLAETQSFLDRTGHGDGRFVVMFAAIENLFALNRSCGYAAGDETILSVASLLRANVRAGDVVARYAGNKFAILLENCGEEEAAVVGVRLSALVSSATPRTAFGSLSARIRIGYVVAPQEGRAPQTLFLQAEEALDAARGPGSQSVVAYTRSLTRDDARLRLRSAADTILSALADNRIEVALQPVVRATDGGIAFYEALLRLRLPDGEVAPLDSLLPAAHKAGLIGTLDDRVMTQVCSRLTSDPSLKISVNCARDSIASDDWIDRFTERVGATPGLGERLIVEVTETGLIENLDAMRAAICACKHLGVRVAMDDFGAGHTSFRDLRALGFDLVKIDGDFVRNLAHSVDDRFFVKTLVDLARHLGLEIVAEWVGDAPTAQILREMGVDYLQGDYCSREE
jgi:diguanylate cyclase (GGDEF)-like protein